MEMEKLISLNGKYPRSEKLIKATRDYERNRIKYEELLSAYEEDYKSLKELQKGFKIISDGLLNWQDLLRPFSELTKSEVNGLKRYFETNTFYRVLKFNDFEIKNAESWIKNYFKFGNLAILPSLGIFKYFSENYSSDKISDMLKTILKLLEEKGYNYFYFQEPSLSFYKDYDLISELRKFFEMIRKEIKGKIILNTYFSDVSEFLKEILKFEIDGIGIDFTFNDIEIIAKNFNRKDIGILAGILDNTNSIIETYEDVKIVLDKILNELKPTFIIISGSCDFELLPREIANKKAQFLKELITKI
jgi:5-methyltetrahydropteroyltriglutamate--homocysteine methyltransferase